MKKLSLFTGIYFFSARTMNLSRLALKDGIFFVPPSKLTNAFCSITLLIRSSSRLTVSFGSRFPARRKTSKV